MWNEFEGTVYCNRLPGNATNDFTCNTTDSLHKSCCHIIPKNWYSVTARLSYIHLLLSCNSNISRTVCGGRVLELIALSEFNVWWNIILMGVLGMIYMIISFLGFIKATRKK